MSALATSLVSGGAPKQVADEPRFDDMSDDTLRKLFVTIDTDGNGYIDTKELQAYLVAHGHLPSFTRELVRALDRDGDGRIDRSEWMQANKMRMVKRASPKKWKAKRHQVAPP